MNNKNKKDKRNKENRMSESHGRGYQKNKINLIKRENSNSEISI